MITYLGSNADVTSGSYTHTKGESNNEGICKQRLVTVLSSVDTVLGNISKNLSRVRVRDPDDTASSNKRKGRRYQVSNGG